MIERFIGIPYEVHGRSYEACDCWGLVWLYHRDVLGVDLPLYLEESVAVDSKRYGLNDLIDYEAKSEKAWRKVEEPQHGDVALVRRGLALSHVGVVAPNGMLLHTHTPINSMLERLTSPSLARRIVAYYRHESL